MTIPDTIPCRSCGGPTTLLLDLGLLPLANSLLDSSAEPFDRYPLRIDSCAACNLAQLRDIVPPEKMFREYVYYTSASSPSVDAAEALVAKLSKGLPSDAFIVEIGSNDGYLLQFYARAGFRVLGIDPATGPADAAARRGVPTLREFFAHPLAAALPRADVIHANNVLAHAPDVNDFVSGLASLLTRNGICIVEVPNLGDLLLRCEFDTIYHEHSYYFSLQSLIRLFARHELYVANSESLAAHGGSLRMIFSKYPNPAYGPPAEDFADLRADMPRRVARIATEFRESLEALRAAGHRVWGFGAAAKATIMLNVAGIDAALIEAVADDTPAKQGKYIPGTAIPIRSSADWLAANPSHTCILAWNHAHAIAHRYTPPYIGEFFTPYILPEKKKAQASS